MAVPPNPAIGRYLRRDVAPYSAHYGPVLTRAAASAGWGSALLGQVPPTRLEELPAAGQLVLRPDPDAILGSGDRLLAARLAANRVVGRQAQWGQTYVDPQYKPVHWTNDGGLPVGWSATDLDRLSELGRRWLHRAGVVHTDVLVSLVAPGPSLAFWQVVFGARRGGLSAIHLAPSTPAADVRALWPNVVVGAAADLLRIATDEHLDAVRVAIVVDDGLDDAGRAALRAALPHADAVVLQAWSPPGTRSLWGECRPGGGLHLDPDADVVEDLDGELVWSALGWHGSVVLRLRTGLAADVESGPCPACGLTGARLRRIRPAPAPGATATADPAAAVLGADRRVRAFHVDRDGGDLVVFVTLAGDDAEAGAILRELDARIGATQYVVLTEEEITARAGAGAAA